MDLGHNDAVMTENAPQENQVVKAASDGQEILPPSPKDGRNANGTFAPGNNANPTGKGGPTKGWQPIGQRYIVLGERYTKEEILQMAADEGLRQERVSFWDDFAIIRMARSVDPKLTATDSGADQSLKEAKEIIDRIEGTAVQTVRTSTLPPITSADLDNVTDDMIDDALARVNAP